jgi:hypothetical protein
MRSLSPRERRLVQAVSGVAVVLVIAVLVSILASGAGSAHGCVHATYAGPVGAGQVNACGSQARSLCNSLGTPGSGFTAETARTIAGECRKAGLRVRYPHG